MDEVQIVLALAVLYVTYRWWSRPSAPSASSTTNTSTSSSDNAANQRLNGLATSAIPQAWLSQVQSMFPQLGEREARWEFIRTGRVRTVDHVVQDLLEGSPTAPPPAWFLPPVVAEQSTMSTVRTTKYESLIQRLGLQKQAEEQDKEFHDITAREQVPSGDKGKATDRQLVEQWRSMSMQEKKAKLVLDSRRRLLEKDKSNKAV